MNSLRETAEDILSAARAAHERLQAQHELGPAIHDLRVAFKRWRALLRLLEYPIGNEALILRHEARFLAREFGRSRDAHSVLDALADVTKPREAETPPFSQRTEATLTRRLQEMRDAIPPHPELVQRLHDSLNRAAVCLASWPLESIRSDDVVRGLAQSYRRARRRLPKKWEEASPEEIHDFRKTVVVFRYQLELIAPLWPKVWHAFIDEVQKVRTQLGKSNDLVALAALTQPRQVLARWRSRLTLSIETRRRFHLGRAQVLAGRIFAESPRSFRKRIETLAKAATVSA